MTDLALLSSAFMNSDLVSHKYSLGHFPTPLEPLKRLSEWLDGPEIWIKRDDCAGLAGGGNKTRKLEYFIADALKKGADTIITTGALQSNHARQTAAAAAKAGLDCVLLLEDAVHSRAQSYYNTGNLLLDDLLHATIQKLPAGHDSAAAVSHTVNTLTASGKRPYVVPLGGSNGLGALAYIEAVAELSQQMAALSLEFDAVIVASGSAGTHAGIIAGAALFSQNWHITGVSVSSDEAGQTLKITSILNDLSPYIPELPMDFHIAVDDKHVGTGYGQPTTEGIAAVRLLARLEAILLDPVYTGKAMAGLINMVQQKKIAKNQRVLFWHTGGAQVLSGYAADFAKR